MFSAAKVYKKTIRSEIFLKKIINKISTIKTRNEKLLNCLALNNEGVVFEGKEKEKIALTCKKHH